MSKLIFALLDSPSGFRDSEAADRAREFSIGFTRFKYSGPIIEDSDPDRLLERATEQGSPYCAILTSGCFLSEVWVPDGGDSSEPVRALETWAAANQDLASGVFDPDSNDENGGHPLLLLVDLDIYRNSGMPPFDTVINQERKSPISSAISRNVVQLDTPDGESWMARTRALTRNLERAVFVWNIESYDDIEAPAETFEQPIKTLYTVAAGFKPNRILHSHGADAAARVVVFDYSAKGLQYRRLLHQEWNGADYPAFLGRLLRNLPPSDAYYLLWQDVDPENLDWSLIENRWQQELDAWGGAQALRDHWQMFRKMPVEYLHCDLLKHPERILATMEDDRNSLIWWSNAFLSIHSIWNYTAAQRQSIYRSWIQQLAEQAPRMHVYGSDCNNLSVNGFTAGEYARWLESEAENPLDVLKPRGLSRLQMRY